MSQSINFLKVLPKTTGRLPAVQMGLILLGVVAFFLISSIMIGLKQHSTHNALDEAKANLLQAQQSFDKLAKAYPLLAVEVPLANRVKALEQQLQDKKDEYKSMQRLTVRRGFSQYLLGLAQSVPSTLWFKQILINEGNGSVILRGFAVRPDDVSQLLSHLNQTPAYTKITFNLFYVKAIDNHPYVKFSVATHDLGPDEDPDEPAKNKTKG